jgi:hypothetical protein
VQLLSESRAITPKYIIDENKWFELPITISRLLKTSTIAIEVYNLKDLQVSLYGSTCLKLFQSNLVLKTGNQKCYLYRNREPDVKFRSSTSSDKKVAEDPLEEIDKVKGFIDIDKDCETV